VGLLLIGGAIAFVVSRASEPHWQTHEPAGGGFKVDLPAAPRDVEQFAGLAPNSGVKVFGTILPIHDEDYGVYWGEIDPAKRAWMTDEQIMNDAVAGAVAGPPPARKLSERSLQVSGFAAREVVLEIPGEGTGTLWVVVAETRFFILFVGGPGAGPDTARAERFLKSFEVTDPRLLAARDAKIKRIEREERQREEQQRLARAREEQNQLARVKAEDDARRRREEAARLHWERLADGGAESVSRTGNRTAADSVQRTTIARMRSGRVAGVALDVAERRQAGGRFVGEPYTGRPLPDPADVPGLILYLGFDDPPERGVVARPDETAAGPYPPGVTLGLGVRGTAAYLPAGKSIDLSRLPPPKGLQDDSSLTITVWFKTRGDGADVVRLINDAPPQEMSLTGIGYDKTRLHGWGVDVIGGDRGITRPWITHNAALAPDGQWHHAALVMTAIENPKRVQRVELYLDGVKGKPHQWSGRGLQKNRKLLPRSVGAMVLAPPDVFPDEPVLAIDEVCVFDRPLREDEVKQLAGVAK
jgi:hypothetical protein